MANYKLDYTGEQINTAIGNALNPSIKANEISSESATSGQVLQADGNGGASWQTLSINTFTVTENDDGTVDLTIA